MTQRRPPPIFVGVVIISHIEAGEDTNTGQRQLGQTLVLHRDPDIEDRHNTRLRRGRRRGRCGLLDWQRTLPDHDVLAPRPPLVFRVLLDELLRVLLDKLPELVLVVREVEAPCLTLIEIISASTRIKLSLFRTFPIVVRNGLGAVNLQPKFGQIATSF